MRLSKIQRLILLCLPGMILLSATGLNAEPFPITNYDYHRVINGFSPDVAATGGLNVTRPHSTHTAFYNPALLAFRDRTTVSATYRYLFEKRTDYDQTGIPVSESIDWNRQNFSYLGIDSESVGFSWYSLASLNMDRESTVDDLTRRQYLDYYLDGYRFSFADRSGLLAFGMNLSLLTGRVVYLEESTLIEQPELSPALDFIDSRGWGYSLDFGAVIKSGYTSYGLSIPNLLGKVYWSGNPDYSLQRRLNFGVQYGSDQNYLVTGISRKFDFSSKSTYHFGLQQMISFGLLRGEYQYMPVRVGVFSERFRRLKDLGYSVGTGYRYSVFQIDFSYMIADQELDRHSILLSVSVGL